MLPYAVANGSIRGGERQESLLAALIYGRTGLFGLQDLVSYAAGFTRHLLPEYFIVTAIATAGHTVVGMTLGSGFMQNNPVFTRYLLGPHDPGIAHLLAEASPSKRPLGDSSVQRGECIGN